MVADALSILHTAKLIMIRQYRDLQRLADQLLNFDDYQGCACVGHIQIVPTLVERISHAHLEDPQMRSLIDLFITRTTRYIPSICLVSADHSPDEPPARPTTTIVGWG